MNNDLDVLQGTWHIASLEVDGAAVGAGSATISLLGDRFATAAMGSEHSGRIELNQTVTPSRLTMHFEIGPELGNSNHGIYEVFDAVGGGWRLCLNMTGGPAPSGFATRPGSGFALETLDRGPAPLVQAEQLAGEPVAELQGEWVMVSCVRSGAPLPASLTAIGRRLIDGVNSTLHFGPQLFMQGVLSRDSGAPNFIRLEHTLGEAQGRTQLGIFDLNGDTLKTCFGATRPEKYASSKAGGETYSVWTRLR